MKKLYKALEKWFKERAWKWMCANAVMIGFLGHKFTKSTLLVIGLSAIFFVELVLQWYKLREKQNFPNGVKLAILLFTLLPVALVTYVCLNEYSNYEVDITYFFLVLDLILGITLLIGINSARNFVPWQGNAEIQRTITNFKIGGLELVGFYTWGLILCITKSDAFLFATVIPLTIWWLLRDDKTDNR